jgi:peptidoglycan glycosyltransferase
MLRRRALSLLATATAALAADPLDPTHGCTILLDIKTQRFTTNSQTLATQTRLPPGSTIKPFVINTLLKHGRIHPDTAFPCPQHLTIAGRRFDCSHPRLGTSVLPDTALAYSCNCYVAHMAERFAPAELARALQTYGLDATPATTPDAIRLQSIGEANIQVTPLALAHAYRRIALNAADPVITGMEDAVDFGTAHFASVPGMKIAGKTGSTRRPATGEFIAWFAGFTASRAPEKVVVVMLSGHSGGADAAPVAAQILKDRGGRP